MKDEYFSSLRQNYESEKPLNEFSFSDDPFVQFNAWFENAREKIKGEVNSFILSTSSKENIPSSRVVLLKGLEKDKFIFFTNYGEIH